MAVFSSSYGGWSHAGVLRPNVLQGRLFGLVGGCTTTTGLSQGRNPVKIVLNNWSSQQVLAHVSGELLKRSGYHVEYHPADAQLQYQAIGSGDLHFQVEVWQGTMAMPFEQQVARKRMIDAGTHDAVTREEWWYPEHPKSD